MSAEIKPGEQKTYKGLGTQESPFEPLDTTQILDFVTQFWQEHGKKIKQGEMKFIAIGRNCFSIAGAPQWEFPFRLHLEWKGFNPKFKEAHPHATQLKKADQISNAVEQAIVLSRRFIDLDLRESLGFPKIDSTRSGLE
jgi:hypothetical protein